MADENKTNNIDKEKAEATEKEAAPATETAAEADSDKKKKKELKRLEAELEKAQKAQKAAEEESKATSEKYMRMLAEYDNFRRRTAKERDGIYADAYGDAIKEVLPVLDNLERAAQYNDAEAVQKGIQMTLKSLTDMLGKLGITEVETKTFDPSLHNAVMHVEDNKLGEGEIVEVLQKGYQKGDKVIRYAMVKVAN